MKQFAEVMTHTLHTHTDVLQPASAAAHHSFGSTQPYRVGFVGFFRPFLFFPLRFFFFFFSFTPNFLCSASSNTSGTTTSQTWAAAPKWTRFYQLLSVHWKRLVPILTKMTEPISARTAAFRKQTPSTPLPSYRSQLSNRLHPSSETLRNISKILSADTKQQNVLQSCMAPGP